MFFFSQFVDEVNSVVGEPELYESHSCSVTNEADAFKEGGPTIGASTEFNNYYGNRLLMEEEGFYNTINLAERVPTDQH